MSPYHKPCIWHQGLLELWGKSRHLCNKYRDHLVRGLAHLRHTLSGRTRVLLRSSLWGAKRRPLHSRVASLLGSTPLWSWSLHDFTGVGTERLAMEGEVPDMARRSMANAWTCQDWRIFCTLRQQLYLMVLIWCTMQTVEILQSQLQIVCPGEG